MDSDFRRRAGRPRWGYGDGRSGLETHVLGAAAELAFCRAIGVTWPARVGNYKGADVDPQWEVRWSLSPLKLKVNANDEPDRLVVMVTGQQPYRIRGYIRAGGVQASYPLLDPGGRGWAAHFVPESRLAPINEGFHTIHAWLKSEGRWRCAFCTAEEFV